MATREWLESMFKVYFPKLHSGMKACREYSVDSLLVELQNGRLLVYDSITNRIRSVYIADDEDATFAIEFGVNMDCIRRNRCLSQGDLARALGVSRWTIARYAHGEALPTALEIRKLANVLNCDYGALLDIPTRSGVGDKEKGLSAL